MVREIDSRYWHLDISHIGNRSRNLYAWEVLDLFILLETHTTAIACNQIRGNPWIGGDLCLWWQDDQVIGGPPVLADDLVASYKGCLRRRAQEDERARRQKKATACKSAFSRLSPERQKDIAPHLLTLSYRACDHGQEREFHPYQSYAVLPVQASFIFKTELEIQLTDLRDRLVLLCSFR